MWKPEMKLVNMCVCVINLFKFLFSLLMVWGSGLPQSGWDVKKGARSKQFGNRYSRLL